MDWTAISAVGQMVSGVAVLVTLLYMARQVRQANRHNMLSAFQHTTDSLNQIAVLVTGSAELSEIMLRGRESYASLSEIERTRFDHLHFIILNVIESHHYQALATAMDEEYRSWVLENLAVIICGYLSFPGTREFWSQAESYYQPSVRKLIAENLAAA